MHIDVVVMLVYDHVKACLGARGIERVGENKIILLFKMKNNICETLFFVLYEKVKLTSTSHFVSLKQSS